MQLQLQTPADPTADVPVHEAELTSFLAMQLARGVSHVDLLIALLGNFRALATVHPCSTAAAGKAALQVGGQLVIASIERPANASVH
jgi:hypothetical protein